MMIDLGKLLKRSWQVLWNYRTLWIFAILLALTAVGGGNSVINFNIGEAPERPFFQPGMEPRHPRVREVLEWIEQNVLPVLEHPEEHISTIIWIVVITVLFLLVIGAALTVVRYVAETAVIRMVDQHEANGEKVGFKAGWRLGWSRRAFHIWVIDLIIGLPVFIFIMLAAASLVLLILSINAGVRTAVAVSIAALGCVFLFIFLLSLVLLFLTLLRNVWVRVAGLEGAGIRAAFRQGWSLFKRNWKSFGLVWLVILGIRIGFSLVSLVLFFLLIPLYFLLAIPAAILSLILG
ncbi:MAG: hypothetical protein NZL98_06780, partial [Anaerolineales bacterium]|nr:hypothetical protein [Anaerolineales bacterium]